MVSCVTADTLIVFARENLQFELRDEDAHRLSKLYTAMIRGTLAALKSKQENSPVPFCVKHWREQSALRRRLFGRVEKHGKTTKRTCGVAKLSNGQYGIVHRRTGQSGYMVIMMSDQVWQAQTTATESALIMRLFKHRGNGQTFAITGQQLRDAVPFTRTKQQSTLHLIRNDATQPILLINPSQKTKGFLLTGEELAYLAVLCGVHRTDNMSRWRDHEIVVTTTKQSIQFAYSDMVKVLFTGDAPTGREADGR